MLPTIIVSSVIGLIFASVIVVAVINKKKGKHTCSCGCGGCAFKDSCHSKK